MEQNGNVGSTNSRHVLVDSWSRTVMLAALVVDIVLVDSWSRTVMLAALIVDIVLVDS